MKELIDERQAGLIILFLSIAVTFGFLLFAYMKNGSTPKEGRRLLWINAWLGALLGPVIWVFWEFIYNPIENYYGLDSLKALKYNALIVLIFAVIFAVLFSLAPSWAAKPKASKRK